MNRIGLILLLALNSTAALSAQEDDSQRILPLPESNVPGLDQQLEFLKRLRESVSPSSIAPGNIPVPGQPPDRSPSVQSENRLDDGSRTDRSDPTGSSDTASTDSPASSSTDRDPGSLFRQLREALENVIDRLPENFRAPRLDNIPQEQLEKSLKSPEVQQQVRDMLEQFSRDGVMPPLEPGGQLSERSPGGDEQPAESGTPLSERQNRLSPAESGSGEPDGLQPSPGSPGRRPGQPQADDSSTGRNQPADGSATEGQDSGSEKGPGRDTRIPDQSDSRQDASSPNEVPSNDSQSDSTGPETPAGPDRSSMGDEQAKAPLSPRSLREIEKLFERLSGRRSGEPDPVPTPPSEASRGPLRRREATTPRRPSETGTSPSGSPDVVQPSATEPPPSGVPRTGRPDGVTDSSELPGPQQLKSLQDLLNNPEVMQRLTEQFPADQEPSGSAGPRFPGNDQMPGTEMQMPEIPEFLRRQIAEQLKQSGGGPRNSGTSQMPGDSGTGEDSGSSNRPGSRPGDDAGRPQADNRRQRSQSPSDADLEQEIERNGMGAALKKMIEEARKEAQDPARSARTDSDGQPGLKPSGDGGSPSDSGRAGDPNSEGASKSIAELMDSMKGDMEEIARDAKFQDSPRSGPGPRGNSDSGGSLLRRLQKSASEVLQEIQTPPAAGSAGSRMRSSPSIPSVGTGFNLWPVAVLAATLLLVAAVWWAARAWQARELAGAGRDHTEAALITSEIRSAEDVLRAFHQLARSPRRPLPDWWTHRAVEVAYDTDQHLKRSAVADLVSIYELARYSPDGHLLPDDSIRIANRAWLSLQPGLSG